MILAIDPGTKKSGYVLWDGLTVVDKGHGANAEILQDIERNARGPEARTWTVAVEHLVSQGTHSHERKSTLQTIEWAAFFFQAGGGYDRAMWVTRAEELTYFRILPGMPGNRDMLLRRAIVRRQGLEYKITADGRMIVPGWQDHTLAALAVACVAEERIRIRERMVG